MLRCPYPYRDMRILSALNCDMRTHQGVGRRALRSRIKLKVCIHTKSLRSLLLHTGNPWVHRLALPFGYRLYAAQAAPTPTGTYVYSALPRLSSEPPHLIPTIPAAQPSASPIPSAQPTHPHPSCAPTTSSQIHPASQAPPTRLDGLSR